MAGSSWHAVLPSEDLETKIASVYQVQAHQSDLSPLRELLLHDSDLTKWVMDLVDKWVSGCVRMRVFTDKWPDCSCAVVFFYQPAEFPYQQSQDLDTKSCESDDYMFGFLVGEQSHKLLCQPGVIDWTKMYKLYAIKECIAEYLMKSLCNPMGKEYACWRYVLVNKLALTSPISHQPRSLPEDFVFQTLQPSDAEYIAQYWPHKNTMSPSTCIAHFKHCISVGSVGVFTDTTPPTLVAWVVRENVYGYIHHLYTLEEYRGRGLASVVVREMSSRIQDEGQIPFCYIVVDNNTSIDLFKSLGFVEQGRFSLMRKTKE